MMFDCSNSIIKNKFCILILLLIPLSLYAQDEDIIGISDEDIYINLKYAGCYQGSFCPRYEITILGNGMVIYEGVDDVTKTGVIQKKIKKQKIADFLAKVLAFRYFEREDESSNCPRPTIKLVNGVYDYEESGVCYTSNHGPFTRINIQLGDMKRKVHLDHYFSNDYTAIHNEIILTAGVLDLIGNDQSH